MTKCPVCGSDLQCKFTEGKTHKIGVMVYCKFDTRHFRAFLNDPMWCQKAQEIEPIALLSMEPLFSSK